MTDKEQQTAQSLQSELSKEDLDHIQGGMIPKSEANDGAVSAQFMVGGSNGELG